MDLFTQIIQQLINGLSLGGIYALIANGLYVNTFANRLVLRFWPPRAATSPRLTLQPGADA